MTPNEQALEALIQQAPECVRKDLRHLLNVRVRLSAHQAECFKPGLNHEDNLCFITEQAVEDCCSARVIADQSEPLQEVCDWFSGLFVTRTHADGWKTSHRGPWLLEVTRALVRIKIEDFKNKAQRKEGSQ